MGRKPIGKTAMTGAERTQQYRERLKAAQPKQDGSSEIANLFFGPAKRTFEEAIKPYQRQIAELNRQLAEAQAKQQQPARDAVTDGKLRDETAALRQTVAT